MFKFVEQFPSTTHSIQPQNFNGSAFDTVQLTFFNHFLLSSILFMVVASQKSEHIQAEWCCRTRKIIKNMYFKVHLYKHFFVVPHYVFVFLVDGLPNDLLHTIHRQISWLPAPRAQACASILIQWIICSEYRPLFDSLINLDNRQILNYSLRRDHVRLINLCHLTW